MTPIRTDIAPALTSKYTLRPYQQAAVDAAVAFFRAKTADGINAIEVLPTGAGKSLVIANIALALGEPVLIFQPSKEILEQNYKKICSYGFVQCAIYSASFNSRRISTVTFCTIGSVIRHLKELRGIKYCIIDECHGVNAKGGMYEEMIHTLGVKVLGLTATPYRLTSTSDGAIIKFLTRTRPCIFNRVIHVTQVRELLNAGFLAKLDYWALECGFNLNNVKLNSTGCDYDEDSLKAEYKRSRFEDSIEMWVRRLLAKRSRVLVFTKFVEEAATIAARVPNAAYVSGETPKQEREQILSDFKAGKIHCVLNVGVLTCLSTDTEILTQRGWASVDDISETDMVAQYDEDESITFVNPIRIIKKEHSGDFVSVEGRYMNIRITDNHNVIYKKRQIDGKLGLLHKAKAADLVNKSGIYIPISGECAPLKIKVEQPSVIHCTKRRFINANAYNYRKKGMTYEEAEQRALELYNSRLAQRYKNPDELTLRECEFIGFWLGDGTLFRNKDNHNRYSITQSLANPKMCEWIENLMSEIGIYYNLQEYHAPKNGIVNGKKRNVSGHRTYNLALGTGGDKQKVETTLYSLIPYLRKGGSQDYWGLSKEQILAVCKGLTMANGYHGNCKPDIRLRFCSADKPLLDLLQAICTCRGIRMMVSQVRGDIYKVPFFRASIAVSRYHELVRETLHTEPYIKTEKVWCVTMPQGTIVTRRNGRVAILGNCGFDYPELDVVLLAKPTRSLAMYYQMVGRAIRPCPDKWGWIVDLCGTYKRFGKVEDLELRCEGRYKWAVWNAATNRQLTNITF